MKQLSLPAIPSGVRVALRRQLVPIHVRGRGAGTSRDLFASMSTQPASGYDTWSNTDLIKRITDLEARLRAQNTQYSKHAAAQVSLASTSQKKPKKVSKPFDPSRYSSRLIALKFAYLGGNYNGFEHHSNNTTPLPTIEEELWKALKKTKLIFPTHKPGRGEDEVSWEGCEYSKCGRTDRGVSAFGQVVGLRVRSNRPKIVASMSQSTALDNRPSMDQVSAQEQPEGDSTMHDVPYHEKGEPTSAAPFDDVRDELPYIQLINRVLPPDIRILAWCPNPPEGFSARFNCKERRYRYYFTNPAYSLLPQQLSHDNAPAEGMLNIDAMREAAKKYEGLHDFRNLCKVDPSKQISNFERRIFHAGIHSVQGSQTHASSNIGAAMTVPQLYYFEVRGSAFLWHQVRHLVAILFAVGQGYEQPSIVDDLLDIEKTPAKPVYEMASDIPLILWDCVFPGLDKIRDRDHIDSEHPLSQGYEDALDWIYVGDEIGGRDASKRSLASVEDGKYGRNGIMDELWALWRRRKMDEVLAWSLMDVVASQGDVHNADHPSEPSRLEISARVFDGGDTPRSVGRYVPIMQRERMETPDVVNARYAARKGLNGPMKDTVEIDQDG